MTKDELANLLDGILDKELANTLSDIKSLKAIDTENKNNHLSIKSSRSDVCQIFGLDRKKTVFDGLFSVFGA